MRRLLGWAQENGLAGTTYAEVVAAPETTALIQRYVTELNESLQRWQTIKKFRLLPHDLAVECGEITPSLKVRRLVVEREHRRLVEEMYTGTREVWPCAFPDRNPLTMTL
ncbi:hypothetical protein AQI96_40190 [Streptomyces canus]|nr:hypothetical protein AQI96_40190 [Streptomyces canus]